LAVTTPARNTARGVLVLAFRTKAGFVLRPCERSPWLGLDIANVT
jgi:hypothetical protein